MVSLPFSPPVLPMLARLVRELPTDPCLTFEPKWDGFRCIAFWDGSKVELHSRNQRPLARYFPEIIQAVQELPPCVLDGEIVIAHRHGFDFEALLQRLHPADSRVRELRHATPACLIAFDLLAEGSADLRAQPFSYRRGRLEAVVQARPHLSITPLIADRADAQRWFEGSVAGVDGVMAKATDMPYVHNKRLMLKAKKERTADCVVAGFRWHHSERTVGSLLLGLYDDDVLKHVGLASGFRAELRAQLLEDVLPCVVDLDEHPWREGFNIAGGPVGRLPGVASRFAYGRDITWIPLAPTRVAEVAYDHLDEDRFRHPPRFRRWRSDRDAATCRFDQFDTAADIDVATLLAHAGR